MKITLLAAVAALMLGASSVAYAGEGEGGETATALQWRAENGNAPVPATAWFAANAAQRQQLSHQYAGETFPVHGNSAQG